MRFEGTHVESGMADRIRRLEYPWHLTPVGHIDCLPVKLAQWASGDAAQPIRYVDYEQFCARAAA